MQITLKFNFPVNTDLKGQLSRLVATCLQKIKAKVKLQ